MVILGLGQVYTKDPKILVLALIAGMSLPFTTELYCYNKNSEKMWRTILNVLKDVQNDLKCDTSILFFSDSHTLIRNISNMKYQG